MQLERDTQEVRAHQARAREQVRPGGEGSDPRGIGGAQVSAGVCAPIDREQALRLNARNHCQPPLQLIRAPQRRGNQRIGSLQHQQRMDPFGKQCLKRRGRLGILILRHREAADRIVIGNEGRAIDAECTQQHEHQHNQPACGQYAAKPAQREGRR